jgi:hypothetical protein
MDHNVQISGLNAAACTLTTPGSIHPVTGMHAGSLRTCWLGFGPVGLALLDSSKVHRLGTDSKFQTSFHIPLLRAYLGAITTRFAGGTEGPPAW